MTLKEKEKELLEPGIIDYLKARSMSGKNQIAAADSLESLIQSIRPDLSSEAIQTAMSKSEPNATIVIAGEMQELKSHTNDMLKKLDIWMEKNV